MIDRKEAVVVWSNHGQHVVASQSPWVARHLEGFPTKRTDIPCAVIHWTIRFRPAQMAHTKTLE